MLKRFQPGEGPSRGLLRDYKPSDGPSFQALLTTDLLVLVRDDGGVGADGGVGDAGHGDAQPRHPHRHRVRGQPVAEQLG